MLYDTFFSRCALPAAAAGLLWLGSLGGFAQEMEEAFSSTDLTGWTSSAGDWQVAEDEPSRVVSPSEKSILAGGESDWENYAVSTRFRMEEGRTAGLVFRYQDPENYYACVLTPMDEEYTDTQDRRNEFILGEGQIRFIRVLDGEKHYLVNYPHPLEAGQWVDLKVEITGPEMTAYVNGDYMLYMEHIELPTGGVGLYSGADSVVSFAGVAVSPLEAPGPDPAQDDFTPNTHRQGVLLNGMWDFYADAVEMFVPREKTAKTHGDMEYSLDPIPRRQMRVPDSFGRISAVQNDHPEVVYERTFDVPEGFGPVVMLEFESVVDYADVYVNDKKVGTHRGEWVSFAFDISEFIEIPSNENKLKVVVSQHGEEWFYWPRGWKREQQAEGGITGDVWLKGYSPVYVSDIFVQPSFRNKNITLEATLRNTLDQPVTVDVNARALADGSVVKEFAFEPGTTVPANGTTVIEVTNDWENPELWWPGEPFLYNLVAEVKTENGVTVDVKDDTRFGFREYWRDGEVYKLNGVEWDTYGDNLVEHGVRVHARTLHSRDASFYEFWSTKERAKEHMRRYMDANVYWLRPHMGPPPVHVIEAADEVGMGILLESSFYQRASYIDSLNNPDAVAPSGTTVKENFHQWSRQCAEMFRNHPSILKWSYTNEGFGAFTFVADYFYQYDGTRPVGCDDAQTVDEIGRQYSYNEAGPNLWKYRDGADGKCRSIGEYSWPMSYVKGDDPLAVKMLEFGLVLRGLRYAGFDDMRAYRMTPIMAERNKAYRKFDAAYEMAKRGMSRVLICDKAYDALGRKPEPPLLRPGTEIERTLVVFNDDYQDGENVLVEWQLRTADGVADSGNFTVNLPKGAHTDHAIRFTTPDLTEATPARFIVKASKNGVEKYLDDQWYRFIVSPDAPEVPLEPRVETLSGGEVPEGAGFDDVARELKFEGDWKHERDRQYYGATKSVSNSAGASVSFDFEGSGLVIYAKAGEGLGSFKVFIDDELKDTVSTDSAEEENRKNVYELKGLEPSSHNVRLEVVGDGFVGLDYFGVNL